MDVTVVQRARLRDAAERLASLGICTAATEAAMQRDTRDPGLWPPRLVTQLIVDVHANAVWLLPLGVDIATLPALPPNPFQPVEVSAELQESATPYAGDVPTARSAAGMDAPPVAPWAHMTGSHVAAAPTERNAFAAVGIDLSIPAAADTRSAAAVLAQPGAGEPLLFDGLLDSLRGVPVDDLDGVGEKVLERLTSGGVASVYDLLMRVPLRYVDRTQLVPLRKLATGDKQVTFLARVLSSKIDWEKRYVRFALGDGETRVSAMFFNAMWMGKRFNRGDLVIVQGDITDFNGALQMSAPLLEPMNDSSAPLMAIYPQSQKHEVSTWMLRRAAVDALRRIDALDDPVPRTLLERRQLPPRLAALRAVHVPETKSDAETGRSRLAYDELLRLQLALGVIRNAQASQPGITHKPTGRLLDAWLAGLPYTPTGAQLRAIAGIREDMLSTLPMNRLLQGDVGAGKAQPLYSKVLTPEGFKTIGEMTVGSTIVNPTGELTTVTGVFPQGERDIYRVHFADGTSVDCDDEHLWQVRTSTARHRGAKPKVMTLHRIRNDLKEKNGANKWHVELPEPMDLEGGGRRPLDPYLLGALLGDGGFAHCAVVFTTADAEMVDALAAAMPNRVELTQRLHNNGYDWSFRRASLPPLEGLTPQSSDDAVCDAYQQGHGAKEISRKVRVCSSKIARLLDERGISRRPPGGGPNAVMAGLRELRLSGHTSDSKFVPDAYLNAPVDVRLAVLQGLLDTDGTVSSRSGADISLVSASKRLAEDVAWLARSLGGRAVLREVRKMGRTFWRSSLQLPNEFKPFRLTRKLELWKARTKYARPAKAIVKVELVGRGPVQCISVAHPNRLYITDDFTITHNTVVLAATALMAIEGGYQAALLAPTEILARQHFEELAEALRPLGVGVDLLVSKSLPRPRKQVLADLADGTVNLVVGTHSLLSDAVVFANLGVALIDEQHRFGVDQRALLQAKGPGGTVPDILQATATPIPRTAAITTYGDLALSILDEKPPGRTPIETTWVEGATTSNPHAGPWAAIREQVAQGRQAFVVCPLVKVAGKESETKMAAAAEETAIELGDGALAGMRIGIATGKQKPDERTEIMRAFKNHELDVLVATTVIEVGVSVPNATVIAVLDAAKFGLAQLHQLRGRVGRGRWPGQCWLVSEATGEDSTARMDAMCETDDGFVLAERDLLIRGPGALTGSAQAGRDAGLLVADLIDDGALHLAAREDARLILERDPQLLRSLTLKREVEAALGDDAHYLTKS